MSTALAAVLSGAAILLWWPPRGRVAVSGARPGAPQRPRGNGLAVLLRRSGTADRDDEFVAELAERLAALLRAGMPPSRAWSVLAASGGPEAPVCRLVVAGLAAGSTVTSALVAAAGAERRRSATADRLRWLAIAWDVVERTGAPAATVLDELAEGLRAESTAGAERDAAMAGPKATATVLAALPAAAFALGALVGANPLQALLGTPAGRISLVLGLICWGLGRWWTRRLLLSAAR